MKKEPKLTEEEKQLCKQMVENLQNKLQLVQQQLAHEKRYLLERKHKAKQGDDKVIMFKPKGKYLKEGLKKIEDEIKAFEKMLNLPPK